MRCCLIISLLFIDNNNIKVIRLFWNDLKLIKKQVNIMKNFSLLNVGFALREAFIHPQRTFILPLAALCAEFIFVPGFNPG